MDELTLPYDILRFDYKERLEDRFLTTHLHRFEMFKQPVAIALVVEILNPWHPTSEYGQKIINNIVREFLRSEGQSYLVRFETSLKQVNKIVAEAVAKLETPVNCVALLLEANQVHCAGIGTAGLGLQRGGRLSTIIGGKPEQTTFSSVTSGDLRHNDWLVLGSNNFYAEVEKLTAETWQEQPSELVNKLVSQKTAQPNQYWAGLFFRYNQETTVEEQTTFWGESRRAPNARLPQISWPNIFSWRPKFSASAVTAFVSISTALVSKTFQNLLTVFQRPGREKLSVSPLWRYSALIIIILAVGLSGLFLYRRDHKEVVSPVKTQNLLTDITALAPEDELKGLLEKFTASDYSALADPDKKTLTSTLEAQKISLTDLPVAVTTTSSPIIALDILNGLPILVDNQGQVWLYKNALLTKVDQKQLIPNPVSLTALAENNIIVTDTTGNIWQLNGNPDGPVALVPPKTLPTNVKIVSNYKNNLYISVRDLKITFRVINFTNSLASAAIYNKGDNLPVAAVNDLAINGNLVAVDNTGQIADFTKGKLGQVSVTMPTVDGAFHLSTIDKSPLIAVASGRLIYLLNQTGAIQKTLFLTADDKITDLALEAGTNNLWVAIGSQLYKFVLL